LGKRVYLIRDAGLLKRRASIIQKASTNLESSFTRLLNQL